MAKARYQLLLEKSKSAALAAIELYNKPGFSYREESFTILIINAWELLLKAKVLKENNGNLKSIHIPYFPKNKDGSTSKRVKYKVNRAGNPMTVSIISLIESEIDDINLKSNLEALIEVRDNSIHLMNESKAFQKSFLEAALASLKNYSFAMSEWFKQSLDDVDLMLIPLAFNAPKAFDVETLKKQAGEHNKLLKYIQKKKSSPKEESNYAVSIIVDVKLEKNKTGDMAVSYDKNGIPMYQESEEEFKAKYPWNYDTLVSKLKERYSDFSPNSKFHKIKKKFIFTNEQYSKESFLDVINKKGPSKRFYSPNCLQEFNKHYNKK